MKVDYTEHTVSIIIVNWNTKDLLLQCVGSIIDSDCSFIYEIIVVDNASSDNSVEALKSTYPDVITIVADHNLGFGSANNLGFQRAKGDYVLILNPDTIVPVKAIDKLVEFLEIHTDVGLVGPLLVGKDGNMQISSFGLTPSPREAFLHAIRIWRIAPSSKLAKDFLIAPDESTDWKYTNHILGACMLARRSVIDKISGFDEAFFLFLEETDLCCRIARAGWKIAYYTGSSIIHIGEQSMLGILHRSGGLYIRSYNLFCRKHGITSFGWLAANACLIMGLFVEATIAVVKHRHLRRALNSLRAIWYGYFAAP